MEKVDSVLPGSLVFFLWIPVAWSSAGGMNDRTVVALWRVAAVPTLYQEWGAHTSAMSQVLGSQEEGQIHTRYPDPQHPLYIRYRGDC